MYPVKQDRPVNLSIHTALIMLLIHDFCLALFTQKSDVFSFIRQNKTDKMSSYFWELDYQKTGNPQVDFRLIKNYSNDDYCQLVFWSNKLLMLTSCKG